MIRNFHIFNMVYTMRIHLKAKNNHFIFSLSLFTFFSLRLFPKKWKSDFFTFTIHTDLFFCSMLHAQNLFYIHILYTQKGVYSIFEYKKNFEREAFRFSMRF